MAFPPCPSLAPRNELEPHDARAKERPAADEVAAERKRVPGEVEDRMLEESRITHGPETGGEAYKARTGRQRSAASGRAG